FKSWTLENNWRDNPRIETDKDGFTELGWLHFGWEQYYALLNCGLRMRPTAGTANGVHPVPAGFSRVYVDIGFEEFTPELWQKRLSEGRSFVTTGPMLEVLMNDGLFEFSRNSKPHRVGLIVDVRIAGEVLSQYPLDRIEIVNGDGLVSVIRPTKQTKRTGEYFYNQFVEKLNADHSTWFAVRCFEKLPDGRLRFAHSAPAFVDFEDAPVRPRRDQVRYLIQRCEEEIARNKDVLSDAELAEYRE